MARFTKISTEHTAREQIDTYTLELRAGHIITRVDSTSRLGAGRKGRAAEVSLHRELSCTCGGHLRMGGLSVAEDLAHLRHFESAAEKEAYEAHNADLKESVLAKLAGKS